MKALFISVCLLLVAIALSLPYNKKFNGRSSYNHFQERSPQRRSASPLGPRIMAAFEPFALPVFSMPRFVPQMACFGGWMPGNGGLCNGAFTPPEWVPCCCPPDEADEEKEGKEEGEEKEEKEEKKGKEGEEKPTPKPPPAPPPSPSGGAEQSPQQKPPPAEEGGSPEAGGPSPQAGGPSPQAGGPSPQAGGASPQAGGPSPQAAAGEAPQGGGGEKPAAADMPQQDASIAAPVPAVSSPSWYPREPPPIGLPVAPIPGKTAQASQVATPATVYQAPQVQVQAPQSRVA